MVSLRTVNTLLQIVLFSLQWKSLLRLWRNMITMFSKELVLLWNHGIFFTMQIALFSVRLKVSQVFVKTIPLKHIYSSPPTSQRSCLLPPWLSPFFVFYQITQKHPYLLKWQKKSLVELDSNVWSISTHLSRAIAPFFSLCGDNKSLSSFCLGNTGLYI